MSAELLETYLRKIRWACNVPFREDVDRRIREDLRKQSFDQLIYSQFDEVTKSSIATALFVAMHRSDKLGGFNMLREEFTDEEIVSLRDSLGIDETHQNILFFGTDNVLKVSLCVDRFLAAYAYTTHRVVRKDTVSSLVGAIREDRFGNGDGLEARLKAGALCIEFPIVDVSDQKDQFQKTSDFLWARMKRGRPTVFTLTSYSPALMKAHTDHDWGVASHEFMKQAKFNPVLSFVLSSNTLPLFVR